MSCKDKCCILYDIMVCFWEGHEKKMGGKRMLLRKKDVDELANGLLSRTMENQQEITIAQVSKEFEDEYSSDQIDRIYHRYRYFLRKRQEIGV